MSAGAGGAEEALRSSNPPGEDGRRGHEGALPPAVVRSFEYGDTPGVGAKGYFNCDSRLDPNRLYSYDDDGNLASVTSGDPGRYFTFDSHDRLLCQGTTVGACDTLRVDYDADGQRIRDVTHVPGSSGGYTLERFYLDDLFTLYVGGGKHYADFHVLAGGQELALKRVDPVTLRTTGLWALGPWPDAGGPGTWLLVLAACGALAGGLVVAGRLGGSLEPPRRPVPAGLALVLVVVLVVPPLPAWAGGGGGGVSTGRRWFLNDPVGSASVVLTRDGLAEREVVYRPFGGIYEQAGSDPNSTIFAGHRQEENSQLYSMNARWQDPETGTFLSVDPVVSDSGDPQSYNAYAYARNNPVSYADPTGAICTPPLAGGTCSSTDSINGTEYIVTVTLFTPLDMGWLDSALDNAGSSFSVASTPSGFGNGGGVGPAVSGGLGGGGAVTVPTFAPPSWAALGMLYAGFAEEGAEGGVLFGPEAIPIGIGIMVGGALLGDLLTGGPLSQSSTSSFASHWCCSRVEKTARRRRGQTLSSTRME